MDTQIQIIDDIKPSLFSSFKNVAISNYITHESVKTYHEIYNKIWIPESFIEFTFEEYRKYAFHSTKDIQEFFRLYSDSEISLILTNYMNSEFSILNKKRSRNGEHVYHIDTFMGNQNLSLGDLNVNGYTNKPLYTALNNISHHIKNSDELVSIKELYEKFSLKRYLKTTEVEKQSSKAPKASQATQNEIKKETATVLVGEKSDIPNQKGKVTKMFFPKLNLPSAFPTSQEKSRVNSERTVRRFMKTDNQVALINKYQFNTVKYHTSFIDKRKHAQNKKSTKGKFDFDF